MNRFGERWPGTSGGNSSGFTLAELLLAAGLTVLIVTFLAYSFSATSTIWRATEHRTDTFREARAALDFIARDLRTVTAAVRPLVTGTLPDPNPPMLVLDYDPETAPPDRVNEEVYAISSLPNAGKSDLCMVGYRCDWDDAAKCYALKRRFKDSDAVFRNFIQTRTKAPLVFADLYARIDSIEDEVAGSVWDLKFRPCVGTGTAAANYPQKSYSSSTELPSWIEVSFKAVGTSAIEKLKSMSVTRRTWISENSPETPMDPIYQRAILPYAQEFIIRVKLEAANPPAAAP